jgi:hypothetical protein
MYKVRAFRLHLGLEYYIILTKSSISSLSHTPSFANQPQHFNFTLGWFSFHRNMSARNNFAELTNEEVDDALNFGMNFDDMHHELQDNSLPALDMDNASVGTRSPSPSFDESGSLTSTGSKRSRATFSRGNSTENEQSPKRRMSTAKSWSASGGVDDGKDTALASIRLDREREGRCPDCGLETHSIVRSDKGYEKTPLNVDGEVLDGRCLFCHPLDEGESPAKEKRSANASKTAQKKTYQINDQVITPQQMDRRTPMQSGAPTPYPTPAQYRKSASTSQDKEGDKDKRRHSWKEHVKMALGKEENGNTVYNTASLTKAFAKSVNNERLEPDDASRGSQYSNRSQISDSMGRLGKAMAAGMGMSCTEQFDKNYNPVSQDSKSPHVSRRSPKMRDHPSSNTTPVSHSSQSQHMGSQHTSPFGGSERGDDGEVPDHLRLAHNKLPSSIYHHHLFPLSQETEQAYIEKTLAYLESGGGDVVDVIVAMRRFPFSLPIQSLCIEKLFVHCFDNDHAHAIVLVGGIRTVIDAMEYHTEDIALQRGCAGIIKHMATASIFNSEMLEKMGAVRCVVNAMKKNLNSAPLLESCCWALGTLAHGPNSDIRLRIAKAGGVHMAMNAVERFPQNESLLRAAFNCLQQLGYNPSSYAAGLGHTQQNQMQQQQIESLEVSPQLQRQHLQQQQQQLENEVNRGARGGNQQMNMNQVQQQRLERMVQSMDPMQQINMNQAQQQQLQRMMQNSDMQQMNMSQTQQQQFQRMVMQQMQMSQNQNQILNRQRQQQMLAMSQASQSPLNNNNDDSSSSSNNRRRM